MNNKKHIGSSFESYLEEEGILEEVNLAAVKAVIANNLKKYMQDMNITQNEMAKQLKTSRTGLLRLLDPENYSVTLLTLGRAATALGKKVTIDLVSSPKQQVEKSVKK